jgi:chromosome segregation ATPase
MARGISDQDVFEAADALLGRGERPTIERVRQELGRGSPNTVNRHLDAWWAALSDRIRGKSAESLPPPLVNLCRQLYEGMRDQAAVEAIRVASEIESRLETDRRELEAQLSAVVVERAAVSSASDKFMQEISALRARTEELVGERAQLQAQIAELNAANRRAEASSQADKATLTTLQSQHLAEIQRIRAQWEGNETRWLKEIDHLREEAKRARTRHEKEVRTLQEQLRLADRSLAASLKEKGTLQTELSRIDRSLQKEREARLRAEAAHAATSAVVSRLRPTSPRGGHSRPLKKPSAPPQ